MMDNIGLLLSKRAMLNPDLEAVYDVATDRRLTYSELDQRCNRIANALAELGVQRGDRVALLQMNSVEFVETFLAIAKIGGICVPLNWRLVADELAFILQDSGTSAPHIWMRILGDSGQPAGPSGSVWRGRRRLQLEALPAGRG